MAPATRRSSGFGSHANSPSNLDHILEHFNQFKRKHITQNRDIIKTNALAQLRIKELEEKVLQLESEKTEIGLKNYRLKSRLEKAEKSIICIRQGWQLIGAGIASISSIEGFDSVLQQQSHQTPSSSLQALQQQDNAHLRPSSRIVLDPNALPGGVVRSVSRPPEADLVDVIEEEDEEQHFIQQSMLDPSAEDTREEFDNGDMDSDNGENGDQVSFTGDGEDTVRIQDNNTDSAFLTQQDNTIRHEDDSIGTSSSLLKPPTLQTSFTNSSNGQRTRTIQRMTSIDSLSSFADDEEIELSTDDEQHGVILNRAPTPANGSRINRLNPSLTTQQYGAVKARTPRKRKGLSSPEDVRQSNPVSEQNKPQHNQSEQQNDSSSIRSETDVDDNDEEDDDDDDDEEMSISPSAVRSSRRSSMRDRKSVNYALPKLNTKMRKPDPVDLVPAVRSERRKKNGSSISSNENSGGQYSENGTLQDTDADDSGLEGDSRRPALKGKHEVASTGNLREIRKLHEARSEQNGILTKALEKEDEERKVGFQSTKEEERNIQQKENDTRMNDSQITHQSPKRRSSRQSLRRRSSSNISNEANPIDEGMKDGVNPEKMEEGRKVDNGDFEYSLPRSQPVQSISKTPSMVSSTPKWRSTSGEFNKEGGMQNGKPRVISTDSNGSTTTGTPIPKPTIRNGQQGNIKALNKAAGRIQKTTSTSSGLSTNVNAGTQQRLKSTLSSNGKIASSSSSSNNANGNNSSVPGSQARVLKASNKANTPSTTRNPPSSSSSSSATTSSSGGGIVTAAEPKTNYPNGDPTKRNSLHAAMTWQELSISQQQQQQ